ncbi:MAG: MFS transporter [Cytophagaceae bacterium]|nr:MFS transporter [Cytophagaceae bacterium]
MKNKRALTILFTANAISGFAQGLTMLSIPWYFQTNDKFSLFMSAFIIITLGSLFWGLYSGTLVDGFNRKDVFLGTNFMGGLIVLSVASLGFREGVLPISLILLVYTTTLYGYIIHFPNLYAFAQEVTEPKDYTRVVSYIEIVSQATAMTSAALGGILLDGINVVDTIPVLNIPYEIHIERWELHEIFLMDAIAFFASFVIVIFIKYQPISKNMAIDEGDLKDRLKVGYNYLMSNKLVTIFGVCAYSIFIVVLVEIFVLLFLYIHNHLQEGADVLGFSEMMFASGSLFSGVIIRYLMSKFTIPKSIIILTFLTTLAFFVASFTKDVWIFYLFCVLIGFTNAGSRIFRVSYLFNLVPNEVTGRVNSIFNVVTTLCRVIFTLIFLLPFFKDGSNVTNAYFFLGLFTLTSGIILTYLYKPLLKLTENIASDQSH